MGIRVFAQNDSASAQKYSKVFFVCLSSVCSSTYVAEQRYRRRKRKRQIAIADSVTAVSPDDVTALDWESSLSVWEVIPVPGQAVVTALDWESSLSVWEVIPVPGQAVTSSVVPVTFSSGTSGGQ